MLADAGRRGAARNRSWNWHCFFAAIGVVVQLKDLNAVWEIGDISGLASGTSCGYVVSLAAYLPSAFSPGVIDRNCRACRLREICRTAYPRMALARCLSSLLVSIFVISLLFAMMFKWLPDADVDWYDVWLGAIITAILFEIGKSAIGFLHWKTRFGFHLRCGSIDHSGVDWVYSRRKSY